MDRDKRIKEILDVVNGERTEFAGIPIEMWLVAQDNPMDERWLECCRNVVDSYESETGKRDTDSSFAQCLLMAEERRHNG